MREYGDSYEREPIFEERWRPQMLSEKLVACYFPPPTKREEAVNMRLGFAIMDGR
jgi:hypothetical protein